MNLSRELIRKMVSCPSCGAEKGENCFANDKTLRRKSNHHQRLVAAQREASSVIEKSKADKRAKAHRKPIKKKAQVSKPSSDFYSSWEWKKARYEALRIHGQRCQCCGWRPGDTEYGYLVVDHIKPRRKFPELALDVNNMQVLCNDCNMGKSNIHMDDFRQNMDWFASMMRDH